MTYAEYACLSYDEKLHFSPEEYRRILEADHIALRKEQARTRSLLYLMPQYLKLMAPVFIPGLIVLALVIVLF